MHSKFNFFCARLCLEHKEFAPLCGEAGMRGRGEGGRCDTGTRRSGETTLTESPPLCFSASVLSHPCRHICAVPPAAAKSLKQCCSVGIPIRLSLHKVKQGLLISLLRTQEFQVVGVAGLKVFLSQVEGDAGGVFCCGHGL